MFKKYLWPIIFIAILASTVLSLVSAHTDGITYDEIAHIGSGYSYLTEQDFRLNPEHPPILKVLSTLPLALYIPAFFVHDKHWWQDSNHVGEYGQWDAGRLLLHESGNATDIVMFLARTPLVLLFAVFGFFLFLWGRKIGGGAVGIFTLFLFLFNPNILAHNHLITTDVGAAASLTVSLYFFLQFVKDPTWRNTLLVGLFFGIANATKFSAIILIPFFILMIGIYLVLTYKKQKHTLLKRIKDYATKSCAIAAMTLFTVIMIYVPFSFNTPEEVLESITPKKIHNTEKQIDIYTKNSILAVNDVPILRPFAIYLHGVAQVFHRVAGGNRTYFMGTVASDADPLYFPTVFVIKEPLIYLFLYTLVITLLVLVLLRSVSIISHVSSANIVRITRDTLTAHFTELTLGLFIIFYMLLAVLGNLTIGIRHLFPIFPPLFLLTASILISAYHKLQNTELQKYIRYTFVGLLIILPLQALIIYPSHLSFFNAFAGGTDNGYNYVVDSNADWGQASKRLKTFLGEHPEIETLHVDYFGGDNISNRLGERMKPLWSSMRPIEPGYYAISTTLLQDSLYGPDSTPDSSYAWTLEHTPIYQIDSSILIYEVK